MSYALLFAAFLPDESIAPSNNSAPRISSYSKFLFVKHTLPPKDESRREHVVHGLEHFPPGCVTYILDDRFRQKRLNSFSDDLALIFLYSLASACSLPESASCQLLALLDVVALVPFGTRCCFHNQRVSRHFTCDSCCPLCILCNYLELHVTCGIIQSHTVYFGMSS